jgi:hypothetical protein
MESGRDRKLIIQQAKELALAALNDGSSPPQAYSVFLSEMLQHESTKEHSALKLGIQLMAIGGLSTVKAMREWIEGFE